MINEHTAFEELADMREQILTEAHNKGVLWVRYNLNDKPALMHEIYRVFLKHNAINVRGTVTEKDFPDRHLSVLWCLVDGIVDDSMFINYFQMDPGYIVAFLNGVRSAYLARRRECAAASRRNEAELRLRECSEQLH